MHYLRRNKLYAAIVGSFMVLSVLAVSVPVFARFSDTDDMVVTPDVAVDNRAVHMQLIGDTNQTPTSTVLVDLSDTTNFKHSPNSGAIRVSRIYTSFTSDTVASTTLQFGVVASTTPEGHIADVYWFDSVYFSTDVNRRASQVLDYSPSVFDLRITSGAPANFVTNEKSMSTSNFATTSTKTSPRGLFTVAPNVGDLVMRQNYLNAKATVTVSVLYSVLE